MRPPSLFVLMGQSPSEKEKAGRDAPLPTVFPALAAQSFSQRIAPPQPRAADSPAGVSRGPTPCPCLDRKFGGVAFATLPACRLPWPHLPRASISLEIIISSFFLLCKSVSKKSFKKDRAGSLNGAPGTGRRRRRSRSPRGRSFAAGQTVFPPLHGADLEQFSLARPRRLWYTPL